MSKHGVTEFLQTFSDITTIFFDVETDLLIVLDGSGSIERVNPAFEKCLNRHEADVLRRGIISLIAVEDLAKFMHAFEAHGSRIPFRMLKGGQGVLAVTLVTHLFKQTQEGLRGFLVLRCAE